MRRNNAKRKKQIKLLILPICIIIIGVLFIAAFLILRKGRYIAYNEESNVNYSVCLVENDYYDSKCVEKGNQYIASLIDYIPANFNYKLNFPNNSIEYVFDYKIIAKFDVLDSNNDKVLYTKREILYASDEKKSTNGIDINYSANIDYNKYNNLLNSFISKYDLNQTSNQLTVSMDVNIKNNQDLDLASIGSKATSITIPLTTKTVNIDISGTQMNSNDSKILVPPKSNYISLLIAGLVTTAGGIAGVVITINKIEKEKTIQELYEERIKKITLAYDSYIQKIAGNYPIGASRICKVSSFKDMLEIKESSEKPLLMLENREKTGTFFLIPVGEGVIYTYAIRIVDIAAEIRGSKAPDYNEDDILNRDKSIKFYTMDKINEDIKNTTEIKIFDDTNAILGTKNSDDDLYEQLGNTAEYKFK